MRKARVEHLDSFDVATAAKNTVLRDGKLTLIDFDIATLFGFPRTRELVALHAIAQTTLAPRCDFRTALHVSLPSWSTVFFAAVATSNESKCSTRAFRITAVAHFAKRAT